MQQMKIGTNDRSERKKPKTWVAPQPKFQKQPLPKPQVFYFDIEAMQETRVQKANLVVVQHEDGTPESRKNLKMMRRRVPMTSFVTGCSMNTGYTDTKQPFIFVAHYLKGYDGYFVLEYLYHRTLFP